MSGRTPTSGPGQDGAQPSAHGQHQSLAQGSRAISMLPLYTPQQLSQVLAAETFWRAEIRRWFPSLHSQTYYVPPLHFSRVSYGVQAVARQSVLVPQVASDQPHPQPAYFPPSGPPPQPSDPPLASRVWPSYQAIPPGPLPLVDDSDVRDDDAVQQVRGFVQQLTETRREVMVVVSQLEFRKYLDNQVNPITAAAVRLMPRPVTLGPGFQRGDFDMFIINEEYSLVVTEIKSVGAGLTSPLDQAARQAVATKVRRAITQLDKEETVLQHLTSDLGPVRIIKTLAVPNVESQELEGILATDQQLLQDLCQCLGVLSLDAAAAVSRCLTADDIRSPASSVWWQRTVTDHGPDANMTPELYERLVARFCGPATTIEVPTLTTPRHTVGLGTMSEGVALAGLTMSLLTLYPEQVNLVNSPEPRVFVWGPPGTGKTVVLLLKAIQWLHQGKSVHLLSTWRTSRAATRLIEHQLLHAPSASAVGPMSATATSATASTSATAATACPRIHPHFYHFEDNKGDVEAAVEELASVARGGELYVIVDECCHDDNEFTDFCTQLFGRVPALHLWAANVQRVVTPPCMREEKLTTPVRCPPAVVDQVAKSQMIDDSVVPRYSRNSAIPAPTDGPKVRQLDEPHSQWSSSRYGDHHTLSSGHKGDLFQPEYCERCGDAITDILTRELRVGQPGQPLQHRDVIILCRAPGEDRAVVRCLRARGVPVQVVKEDADEAVVCDLALAVRDAVTVTAWRVVSGLERRVVVVMGRTGGPVGGKYYSERIGSMSRSTALVIWAGTPLYDDDDSDDDDDE